jgi:hypothetical protein
VTIQKKSLINSLNTTKKALVATTPEKGSAASGAVKPTAVKASALTHKASALTHKASALTHKASALTHKASALGFKAARIS